MTLIILEPKNAPCLPTSNSVPCSISTRVFAGPNITIITPFPMYNPIRDSKRNEACLPKFAKYVTKQPTQMFPANFLVAGKGRDIRFAKYVHPSQISAVKRPGQSQLALICINPLHPPHTIVTCCCRRYIQTQPDCTKRLGAALAILLDL